MAKNISIYPGSDLDEACAINGGGRNKSHRINQIADRYREILRRTELPEFSEAEMKLMQDSTNGSLYEPATQISHFWHGIEDSILLDGLDKKWAVDGPALIERLKSLSFTGNVALLERIERMWAESRAAHHQSSYS